MRNKLKEKDRTEKLFIVENEVFCDIFNAICFDGRKVIKEKEIQKQEEKEEPEEKPEEGEKENKKEKKKEKQESDNAEGQGSNA